MAWDHSALLTFLLRNAGWRYGVASKESRHSFERSNYGGRKSVASSDIAS